MLSPTTSSSSSREDLQHKPPWAPHCSPNHNFIQVLRKHYTLKAKRPSLFSSSTWPRPSTNAHHHRPELASSNSNFSKLSHDVSRSSAAFQYHRLTHISDSEPPSIPFRNPKRISDIQDSKISNAFVTILCCQCFRYITLHSYHYECSDEGCRETICNECIEVCLQNEVKWSDSLESMTLDNEYKEVWKKMNFLQQFEAIGKSLDVVCRLYPVKIVQKRT